MAEYFLNLSNIYFILGSIGFTIGGALMLHNVLKNGVSFPWAIVAITACIYGGLLGTRILFVLTRNPRLFLDDLSLALAFWQGGLSWMGGPVLGCVVFLIVMRMAGKPGWANVGSAVPGLAVAHAFSRTACLARGCCYGAPTTVPWAIYSDYLHTQVHPSQVYSMINELFVAGFLQYLWWKKPEGRKYLMPLYGVLLGGHRFIGEFFRGDPAGPVLFPDLRFFQSVSIIIGVVSLAIILTLWKKRAGGVAAAVLITGLTVSLFLSVPRDDASHDHAEHYAESITPSEAVEEISTPEIAVPEQVEKIDSTPVYLVATRTMFLETLQPWIAYREDEGFNVIVKAWDTAPTEMDVLGWIDAQSTVSTQYVLLIGDAGARGETSTRWHLPAARKRLAVGDLGTEYSYDAPFGDFDHDGRPDVPVGRLPVRDAAGLEVQVIKILEYEQQYINHDWFRTVIWTGAEGIRNEMDHVTAQLSSRLPDWMGMYRIGGLDHLSVSENPLDAPTKFLNAIQNPAMFSFIACHGAMDQIWTERSNRQLIRMKPEDIEALDSDRTLGPLFLLACQAGTFDQVGSKGPSIAEAFLNHRGGPISVVAASGTMHPMTNYFVTKAMLDKLDDPPETIGQYFLHIQQTVYDNGEESFLDKAAEDDLAEYLLGPIESELISKTPRVLQHECLTYNFLGDPAAHLYPPAERTNEAVEVPQT